MDKGGQEKEVQGKGKEEEETELLHHFLSNLRGFRSKKTSLDKVVKDLQPSVLMYNETLLYGKNKVEHDGYICFFLNGKPKKEVV